MILDVDITPEHYQVIANILANHLPVACKVWAFGSRVTHTSQAYSDLDLAIDAGVKLDYSTIMSLKTSFEDSRLPYTVDVVDVHSVEPYFKTIIDQQKVVFPIIRKTI